ncbi:hypothetical protein DSO57_1029275 [Entomophthora muscae]|uniref:Uncharacterized protein n=1 Tax=Entomophthora muscae TaxID=34485 RepID=A0ACC2SQA1_9FUNG|nr:hypothetical protein DSO57_1029275 [Entomophthora muscae]
MTESEPTDTEAPPILILFHDISDNSDLDDSDIEDPDVYGYSVLAVPKTIAVPYKIHSGKITAATKPLPEAKEVVLRPYLTQAKSVTEISGWYEAVSK